MGGLERLPYDRRVKIKMSISLDPELDEAVREAAAEAGMTLPEWLGRAAETKLKQDTDARILEEAARNAAWVRTGRLREVTSERTDAGGGARCVVLGLGAGALGLSS